MKAPISTAVAVLVGLLVLAGTFVPVGPLAETRALLVGWAVILAALAAWVGVANLMSVHFARLGEGRAGSASSLILVAAFFLALVIGVWDLVLQRGGGLLGQVVGAIQFPVESSLMAVLSVSLALAAVRLLGRKPNSLRILFFISTVLFLLIGSGLLDLFPVPEIPIAVAALERLPVSGARGILLGIALGSLTTGLRVLLGANRPFRG